MKIRTLRITFAAAFASAMMLFVCCGSAFAQNEDSLRYLAGPRFASSNVDSLVLEDFDWCNRYVMPNQPWARLTDMPYTVIR